MGKVQTYRFFQDRVRKWARLNNIRCPRFNIANGRYYANFPDGDYIVGNGATTRLSFFLNGHEHRIEAGVM